MWIHANVMQETNLADLDSHEILDLICVSAVAQSLHL